MKRRDLLKVGAVGGVSNFGDQRRGVNEVVDGILQAPPSGACLPSEPATDTHGDRAREEASGVPFIARAHRDSNDGMDGSDCRNPGERRRSPAGRHPGRSDERQRRREYGEEIDAKGRGGKRRFEPTAGKG